MAEEKLKAEQEAQLAIEQKKIDQQHEVSKVLLDGLYDQDSNLSNLRGTQIVMRKIWHACSGLRKLVNTWEDFPAAPSAAAALPEPLLPSSSAESVGTQTDQL